MPHQDPELADVQDVTLDLNAYWRTLRAHARTIWVFCGVFILLGIVYLHITTPKYTVTMEVTPVETNSSSLGSSLAGLSGLASVAGVNLPSSQGQRQLELYLAALTSPNIAQSLLNDSRIASVFFPGSWDPATRRWVEPRSALTPVKNVIKSVLGFPIVPWHPPTPKDLVDMINRAVAIDHRPTSPIVTITYENRDPQFAQMFLGKLHAAADDELRARAMRRATAYITYLTTELKTVTSTEQREAMISTLSSQENQRMAAGAKVSYSVDVFSSPTSTAKPTSPQAPVTLLTSLLLGAFSGALYVLWRYRRRG